MSTQHIKELLLDAPPVSVATVTLFGVSLNTYILVFTLIYTVLRLVFFLYDRWTLYKRRKEFDES